MIIKNDIPTEIIKVEKKQYSVFCKTGNPGGFYYNKLGTTLDVGPFSSREKAKLDLTKKEGR